ncbi:MAG: FadR family transcriptional regulator [Clostridia bacterium]|nr:FadR family transcriptional regulator [Clostridia bacterium]
MEIIKRTTLGEQILASVVNIIKRGGYSVGDRLPTEKEIAESLGVGRNSVREAMKALNMAGVTSSVAGKGTFLLVSAESLTTNVSSLLSSVSEFSLLELLEARRMIETESAVLAAKRKSEGILDLSGLRSALLLLEERLKNRDVDASHTDFDFHIELVRLGNNRFLDKMLHSIVKDIECSKKIVTIDFDSAELEIMLHKNIFNAISNGDINAARDAMAAHFDNTERYYHSC